jgi:hypothetical protein
MSAETSKPTSPTEGERFTDARPDRPPTPDEAAAADRAAADVDMSQVSEAYEEMAERGANVRGEGEIEPG